MDIRSAIVLEVTKNDNKFQFIVPVGVPLGQVYDAAFEVLNQVVEMTKDAASKAERQDDTPSTEVTPDAIN